MHAKFRLQRARPVLDLLHSCCLNGYLARLLSACTGRAAVDEFVLLRMGKHLGRGIAFHSQGKQRTGVVKCNPLQHDRVQLGVALPGETIQLVAHGGA